MAMRFTQVPWVGPINFYGVMPVSHQYPPSWSNISHVAHLVHVSII